MHIDLTENRRDLPQFSQGSGRYLEIYSVGETLEELRDVTFLRPHGTPDYAVKYLEKGKREYDFGHGWESVREGTVLLYAPGEISSTRVYRTDESNEFFIHFYGTAAAEIWRGLGLEGKKRLFVGRSDRLTALFREIIGEFLRNRPGSKQAVNARLIDLLIEVSTLFGCAAEKALRDGKHATGDMWDERLAPALRIIHYSYGERITIDRLADECHLSKYYFSRLFREKTGISPYSYYTKVRIRQACRLLKSTDEQIAQIAVSVGIPDEKSFRTLFRHETGCSPSEYRNAEEQDSPVV